MVISSGRRTARAGFWDATMIRLQAVYSRLRTAMSMHYVQTMPHEWQGRGVSCSKHSTEELLTSSASAADTWRTPACRLTSLVGNLPLVPGSGGPGCLARDLAS